MRIDIRLAVMLFATCAFGVAGAQTDDASHRWPAGEVVETIAQCLSGSKEIVMAPQLACVERGSGADIAEQAGMPLQVADPQAICRVGRDARILSGGVIRQVALQTKFPVAPSGIRIVGALYCDDVDLVGLDVPFSIVLDRSIFVKGINARNLKMRGDFSIDYGASLDRFLLNRTRIDGSVYAQNGFIYRFTSSDTTIAGSFHLNQSLVLRDVQFFRVALTGDLSISESGFSSFLQQSSRIGGILDLNYSQARCGYYVKASDIGYVMALDAGFGAYQPVAIDSETPAIDLAWWRPSRLHPAVREIFRSPLVKPIVSDQLHSFTTQQNVNAHLKRNNQVWGCESSTKSEFAEFYFFDNHVQTTVCLREFGWLAPEKDHKPNTPVPISILGLNGSKITGNLIVDLTPSEPTSAKEEHKLEAIGASAGALIFNFPDNPESYFTFIDNLTFDRVHKAKLTCEYQPGRTDNRLTVGELGAEVELPSVDEVLQWLDKNEAKSSQPFTAFTEAFERAGASAIPLRVKHKTKDLEQKWQDWLDGWTDRAGPFGSKAATASASPQTLQSTFVPAGWSNLLSAFWQPIANILWRLIELIAIVFQFAMGLLADYGLRPGKVVGWVVLVLLVFWLWFRFRLNIIGFEPKSATSGAKLGAAAAPGTPSGATSAQPEIWPLSYLFLFDRLIPVYHIREEHYGITNFYRKVPAREVNAARSAVPPEWRNMPGRKGHIVRPASKAEGKRVEGLLLALRIIGVVLSVFLLAAINALTSK